MRPNSLELLLCLSAFASANLGGLCIWPAHHRRPRQRRGPGSGRIGAVASSIIARVPGSDVTSVDYPATIDNVQNYAASEHQGTLAMTKLVQDYVTACPRTKILLLGNSQGADVVGDALCGTSSDISPKTEPLGAQHGGNVFAVVVAGTRDRTVVFVRRNTAPCQAYANLWQDYCDTNDYCCDSAPLELVPGRTVHAGYVARYGTAATDFVVSRAAAAGLPTRTAAPVAPNKGLLGARDPRVLTFGQSQS
ncbi:cutinase-domain-containing protein [Macrophomina phaseolina]|uniref:Cutinase-domain-containing protein n=1 Tax=Macrophomina phaseolina TaxID=35725 RepID=A0ABQ8G1J1_9PEZI|nr:cutinase-domain-containing protein [Macrophomina phaseolina]